MDLTTKYLGFELRTPLIVGASPLSENIDNFKKMEDAGASAVVMFSLFEEQIRKEQFESYYHSETTSFGSAEAATYFPEPNEYRAGTEEYLSLIRKAKEAVKIPVIASLNGSTLGGWTEFAKKVQEAGADAIELNNYSIPTDVSMTSQQIEKSYIDILKAVKSVVTIPVSIKLSPFFSNIANMAHRFDEAGADALVLFNRFYQPDVDLDNLEIVPHIELSSAFSLRLPLTWIGILKGKIKADFSASRGVHCGKDALKLLMVGADSVQLCSTLLKNGIGHIKNIENEMVEWMTQHEYESVKQLTGSMSQKNIADPTAFERAQYMKALTSYRL